MYKYGQQCGALQQAQYKKNNNSSDLLSPDTYIILPYSRNVV